MSIFGLRRSGNHAIIEWIAAHFNRVWHENDCIGWGAEATANCQVEYGDRSRSTDFVIKSYEDFEPSEEELASPDTILILRDWYGVASSRGVSGRSGCRKRHSIAHDRDTAEVWCAYAKLYLQLPQKFILFNQWTSSESYRQELEQRLHLPGHVPYSSSLPSSKIGRGSSFHDQQIASEKVNNRLTQVAAVNPALFAEITGQEECAALCRTIFGIQPPPLQAPSQALQLPTAPQQ